MINSPGRKHTTALCARQQRLQAQADTMVALTGGGVTAVRACRSGRRASLLRKSGWQFQRGAAIGLSAVVGLLLSGFPAKAQTTAQEAWVVNPEKALQWYTAGGWEIKAATLASDAKTLLMVITKDQHIKICPIAYETKGNSWHETSGCQRVK